MIAEMNARSASKGCAYRIVTPLIIEFSLNEWPDKQLRFPAHPTEISLRSFF